MSNGGSRPKIRPHLGPSSLQGEVIALRHQLNVLRRSAPERPALTSFDRFILVLYMARHRCPPSQGWRTFLLNHVDGIASIDLFVVPTVSFRLLYGLLVLRHDRRRILRLGVTAHPTAEWIAQQVTEACGWESAPQYLILIGTGSTARHLRAASGRWAFATERQRRDLHGRTGMRSV